jgi:hypothetical protein
MSWSLPWSWLRCVPFFGKVELYAILTDFPEAGLTSPENFALVLTTLLANGQQIALPTRNR